MLLLDHVGARSGTKRTSPLLYLADGDDLVIVASKGGYPKNPAWFHNLVAHPDTTVQVGRERRAVHARIATAKSASDSGRWWSSSIPATGTTSSAARVARSRSWCSSRAEPQAGGPGRRGAFKLRCPTPDLCQGMAEQTLRGDDSRPRRAPCRPRGGRVADAGGRVRGLVAVPDARRPRADARHGPPPRTGPPGDARDPRPRGAVRHPLARLVDAGAAARRRGRVRARRPAQRPGRTPRARALRRLGRGRGGDRRRASRSPGSSPTCSLGWRSR